MKRSVIILLVLVLVVSFPIAAMAAGGDGSGSGSGDGPKVESASVEEGGVIAPTDSIVLTFSNNVVNAGVREKNGGLVTLTDASGHAVEIDVVMADDQVEPDKKRIIEVSPKAALEAGVYTLTAKAGITAKNGTEMKQDFVLTFTVAAPETATAPVKPEPAAEPSKAEPTAEPAKPAEAAPAAEPAAPAKQGVSPVVWVFVAAVAVVAAVVLVRKKKA